MKTRANTDPTPPLGSPATALDALPRGTEDAIFRALAREPFTAVPGDFAARITARAVAQPGPGSSPWAGFGLRIAAGSAILLTIGMFAVAPHTTPSFADLRFDLELALLAELGAVAYGLGLLVRRE